jgi:hypothetical protein
MDENHSESVAQPTRRRLLRAGAGATALAAAPVGAIAQEDETETETSSSNSTGTTTETESETETVLAQITEGVTLVDYEILSETADSVEWRVIVDSTYPTQLVLSDVLGSLSSGGGSVTQVEQDRRTITSGRTAASITTGTYDDQAALGVAVPGGAVNIGHGLTEDEPLVTLPFGITLGASIFAAGTIYSAKKKKDGYRNEPEDVDPKDGWL